MKKFTVKKQGLPDKANTANESLINELIHGVKNCLSFERPGNLR